MVNGGIKSRFRYGPEDVSCELCTEYRRKQGCTAKHCLCLAERVEAGVVGYEEAAYDVFITAGFTLDSRLRDTACRFDGNMWDDTQHEKRMEYQKAVNGYRKKRDTPACFAAMYLLTSGESIYKRTYRCFQKSGIDFHLARVRGILPDDYVLLHAARDIYRDEYSITAEDMTEPEMIGDGVFTLIVNALLIARFGLDALSLRRGEA